MSGRSKSAQQGFTLVELMVVVAIVGVLAVIAVTMFTGQTDKAKAAEVRAVFAEIQTRQEQNRLEIGNYTCLTNVAGDTTPAMCDDTDLFPDATPGDTPRGFAPAGTDFERMKMKIDKVQLLCSYASVGGPASNTANWHAGSIAATQFGLTSAMLTEAANDPWYYMVARCNLDGDPTTDSFYFMRSDQTGFHVVNAGR